MPKINLSGMTVEALMDLRKRVEEMLLERRAEIESSWTGCATFAGVLAPDERAGGRPAKLPGSSA